MNGNNQMIPFRAFGTIINLSRSSVQASPFLSSLLLYRDSGTMHVETKDGIVEIAMPDHIEKEDWQSYLFYLRTGDMFGTLLDQGEDGILSFMGHTSIDPSLPIDYRRAIYRDLWGENRGLDGLYCFTVDDGTPDPFYISMFRIISNSVKHKGPRNDDPIALLRSLSLDHEKVITNGKHIWMTHKAYYMYTNDVIYVDGSRLRDYDLEFLISWKEKGHHLQMIGGQVPYHLVRLCKDIDIDTVRAACYLLYHDDAIHVLCLTKDGILKESPTKTGSNPVPLIYINSRGQWTVRDFNPTRSVQDVGRAIRTTSLRR